MILVTVGTQLPFDRLILAMNVWAANHPDMKVFAQTGNSALTPAHMDYARHLDPEIFREKCAAAPVIVSHAGIGNVLLALELQKPLIIMPRRAELKEHRNDHQMATAKWLKDKPGITVVYDATELDQALKNCTTAVSLPAFSPYASDELLTAVKDFINQS